MTTDANGDYIFNDVTAGLDYTVTASRNTNHVEGVTAIDLALIQRHILNVQMLDSPYKIIAADVDVSGLVSGIDLVKIQQLILNITTEFPDFNSWRFVDENYSFINPANPLLEAFPEYVEFTALNRDTANNDFIAMKLGDVNNSAMGAQEDEDGNLNLVITETTDVNGDRLVQFRSADYTNISAYQFDIWFDQYQMELVEVIPGNLPGLNDTYFGKRQLNEGLIKTLWYDPTGNVDGWELEADEVLFSLRFRGDALYGELEDRVQANVASMHSAGYTNTGKALEIQTDYRTEVTTDTDTALAPQSSVAPLSPNPFRDEATVRFNLAEGGLAEIEVRDINGKQVWYQQDSYNAGEHQLRLNASELPNAGMYYLIFRSGTFVQTQKIIFQP